MTVTVPQRGPEIDAVIAVLAAGGLKVGDAQRPEDGGFVDNRTTGKFHGYVVVFAGVVAEVDGPVSDPQADTAGEVQLTSVGLSRGQADKVADRARELMLRAELAIAGRAVQRVEWVTGQPVERDDDVVPPVFYVADVFAVHTTPSD